VRHNTTRVDLLVWALTDAGYAVQLDHDRCEGEGAAAGGGRSARAAPPHDSGNEPERGFVTVLIDGKVVAHNKALQQQGVSRRKELLTAMLHKVAAFTASAPDAA